MTDRFRDQWSSFHERLRELRTRLINGIAFIDYHVSSCIFNLNTNTTTNGLGGERIVTSYYHLNDAWLEINRKNKEVDFRLPLEFQQIDICEWPTTHSN